MKTKIKPATNRLRAIFMRWFQRQLAADVIEHIGIDTAGLRSKALDEFAGQQFHYVITLCDKSSEEAARMPSSGEVIVWNFEDPVTSDRHEPFRHTLQEIHDRLHMFITVKTRS